MQRHGKNHSVSRFARPRVFMLAVAVLAIAGGTFAATGGVAKLKSWLLNIEINGELTQIELDDDGQRTLTVDTEDGGTATIHVQKSSSPEEGEQTRIEVVKSGNGSEEEDVVECVRRVKMGLQPPAFTLDDLAQAEPFKTWMNEEGQLHELYILPAEEGDGSEVVLVTSAENEEPEIHLVAATGFPLIGEGIEPDIEIDMNGLVTIKLENSNGQVQVIKARIARLDEGAEFPEDVNIETPDGQIKVSVTATDEEN